MGDATNKLEDNGGTSSAPAGVICEEFLKVLSRKEVEQPMICQNLCLCAQFWRYQHYLLPCWDWGITKLVCLDLGSFRNTQPNGGPFPDHIPPITPTSTHATNTHTPTHPDQNQNQNENKAQPTYAATIRNPALRAEFNARPLDGHDPLQTMLRHAAAIEVAGTLALCASRRGIEHGLVKVWFKRLEGLPGLLPGLLLQSELGVGMVGDEVGVVAEGGEGKGGGKGGEQKGEGENKERGGEGIGGKKKGKEKKTDKLAPIAAYAGDLDLVDVPVYFCGQGYTAEDRQALAWAAEVMHTAQLPLVNMAGGGVDEVCRLVDRRTLLYTVGLDRGMWREVLRRCKPAAVIAGGCAAGSESGDAHEDGTNIFLDDYEEFKLDKARAPHTIGSSHLYIRGDIVEAAEREAIVPPYPITFPHDYPYEHRSWYLNKLKTNGCGKVVRREEGS